MRTLIALLCVFSLTGCGIVKRATRIVPIGALLLAHSEKSGELETPLEKLEIACEEVTE